MRAYLTGCVMLWLCLAGTAVAETRDARTHFFDQGFGNLQEEAAAAREEGKRGVFIMFEQDECPWCAKMMATVMSEVAVQEFYRKHFRTVHVDMKGDSLMTDFVGKEMAQKEFAFQHRVRATPVFMFFDVNGKELTKYTGATRDTDEFMWLAQFVVNGDYKSKNFTAYKRERQAQKR